MNLHMKLEAKLACFLSVAHKLLSSSFIIAFMTGSFHELLHIITYHHQNLSEILICSTFWRPVLGRIKTDRCE